MTDEKLIECLTGMAGLVHSHGGSTQPLMEAIQAIRDRAAWVEAWEKMREEIAEYDPFGDDKFRLGETMDTLDPRNNRP